MILLMKKSLLFSVTVCASVWRCSPISNAPLWYITICRKRVRKNSQPMEAPKRLKYIRGAMAKNGLLPMTKITNCLNGCTWAMLTNMRIPSIITSPMWLLPWTPFCRCGGQKVRGENDVSGCWRIFCNHAGHASHCGRCEWRRGGECDFGEPNRELMCTPCNR